ncbi:hypothetical protein KX729_06560 [Rhizobium sp. XQZ8]|uniref:hypothetical protein n=1 Tax=Rhizobium populisoli TaxID=2859785 RepID=UPI001CA5C79A|nr:hypothetical protein [Rhizobium populisoli]MBW6421099.1 hypothetical protein [Rhizobium populisoli]
MTPLKIFLSLKEWLQKEEALTDIRLDDPLLHPDIQAMTLRQLADLPFPGRTYSAENCQKVPLAKCA